jgi:hypothetical protein
MVFWAARERRENRLSASSLRLSRIGAVTEGRRRYGYLGDYGERREHLVQLRGTSLAGAIYGFPEFNTPGNSGTRTAGPATPATRTPAGRATRH